jgi:uncharacterized membrane protein YqiK
VLLWVVAEIAAVVVVAVVGHLIWDRHRYRGSAQDGAGLERTDEVFLDPATGRRMRVFFDPRTGRRVYREDAP